MAGSALTDSQLSLLLTMVANFEFNEGWESFLSEENWNGGANGQTLGTLLKKLQAHSPFPKDSREYAQLEAILNDPALANLRCADMHSYFGNDGNHQMVTFLDEDGNPIVVFQGTQPGVDIVEDVEGGLAATSPAQLDAYLYVKHIYETYGGDITVTGHSLGGNLAQYVTITFPHIARCVTFNAPGFSAAFLLAYSDEISLRASKIKAYANDDDNVNKLLNQIVNVIQTHGSSDTLGAFGDHDMGSNYYYVTDGDGCHIVFNESGSCLATGSSYQVRDFSDAKLQEILDIIEQIGQEKWWDVSHWQCWYQIEDANILGLGRKLQPENYQHDMDSYWRKVMDVNDTTPDEVRRIFERARERDSRYAKRLEQVRDSAVACAETMRSFLAGA